MKKIISVIRIIVIALLCVLLALNLWMLFSRFVLKEAQPKLFGFSKAVVLSGSMAPEFLAGDMLILRENATYNVGDVIMFSQNGDLITHRIVQETADGFVTRGDANNTDDSGTVLASQIEGSLWMVIPRGGGLLSFFQSPYSILLLLALGWIVSKLPDIAESIRKRRVT